MGIKGLGAFLRSCVDAQKTWESISLERLRGHRVAIDMLNIFHRHLVSAYGILNTTVHDEAVRLALKLFLHILESFVGHGIVPVVVCDGQATKLKTQTQITRRKQTDKYASQQVDSEIRLHKIKEEQTKPKQEPVTEEEALERSEQILVTESEIADLKRSIVKCVKGSVRVSDADKAKVREFVYHLGIPFVQAEGDAEKECAQLVREGHCIAAVSNDTDMLVHGCTAVITELFKPPNSPSRYAHNTAKIVMLSNVLTQLNLSMSAFIDFCIMCGTDYNPNVRGYGPVKCIALIRKYGSLDKMPDVVDPSRLDTSGAPKTPFCKTKLCNEEEGKSYIEIRREFLEHRQDIDVTKLELDECDLDKAAELCSDYNFDKYAEIHSVLMNTTTYKVPFSVEEHCK